MPITMLDTVDFTKVPSKDFVMPTVTTDPTIVGGDEGRLIYNTTANAVKYCDGSAWKELGLIGSSGPPTGAAGGALTGSYPDPTLVPIVDAQVAAGANIAQSKIAGLTTSLTGKADSTIDIIAGNGLTGGGTLAASRTLTVVGDANLSVTADLVSVLSAPKWTTARTVTVAGDTTSSAVSVDGTANWTITTAIAAGVIVDADVNSAAAIATSKIAGLDTALAARALTTVDLTAGAGLTGGGTIAANRTFAVGAGTGITVNADDVAINLTYADARWLLLSGGTLTNFLTLHADPTSNMHAASKQYVDVASQGFAFKQAVRCVSTTNQASLSGLLTIDGITLVVGNRVLLAGQTTASQNGIYVAASGAWTRATDMDASGELTDGTLLPVAEGTLNQDSQWMCTAVGASPWVPGSSTSTWTKFSSLQDLQAGAGLLRTGNVVDIVGDATMNIAADSIGVLSAPKWTTGRTITLTGDVTGVSTAMDGTANLSFATAYAPLSIVDGDISASAAIATSKISGLDTALTGKVPTTRSVLAGNGLTGGGTLAADVTLNVVGDANMTVAADAISILSAPKWTTARSFSLTGDVTGTVAAVDGTANVSIATTLVGGAAFPKKYAIDVPAGTTGIVITHNLNTLDVVTEVYQKSNGSTVYCDILRPTVNTITLSFAAAVSAGVYRVVVTG